TPSKPQDMFAPIASLANQPNLKPGDEAANVRQVIQNAQLLIQKGGGEMKIQMSPEGMGHVDLKVSVQDGKVDIKMLTENTETKKLLESGLSDLRENLIGHKLNIDSVKVDVAQKFQPDLDSQLAQQQREMAREFLGQFRQQNQANRQGFADTTGLKSYGKRSKTMTPADVPAAARARDNSRRLDLVA
ncbi:MAG TPA: flagellar hook-length control protein FliK, partial [Bdellovibrionales bacterium]|nr:flagellar hook-length control protein FliK [Bdellovibrionales bacterium]